MNRSAAQTGADRATIATLERFLADDVATFGRGCRDYPMRCIAHWRSTYGDAVADHLAAYLGTLLAR